MGWAKPIFAGLPPGVYTVSETVLAGWEAMSDNPQTVIHRDCEKTPVRIENKEIKGELSISGRKLFKAWVAPYAGTVVGLPGWVMTATLVGNRCDDHDRDRRAWGITSSPRRSCRPWAWRSPAPRSRCARKSGTTGFP